MSLARLPKARKTRAAEIGGSFSLLSRLSPRGATCRKDRSYFFFFLAAAFFAGAFLAAFFGAAFFFAAFFLATVRPP